MPVRSAPFDVDRLTALGRVTEVAPSPDGRWLAVSVQRLDAKGAHYVTDLWRVPLEGSPRTPVRLTHGDSDDRRPRFRRDGSLGFLSDRQPPKSSEGGGARDPDQGRRSQVWLFPAGGGEPLRLTEEPLGVSDFRFATHGDRMVVIADVLHGVPHEEQLAQARELRDHGPSALHFRDMPVRRWDRWMGPGAPHVIAYDDQGRKRVDLTTEADREHREYEWDLSPDGSTVVITCERPGKQDRFHDRPLRAIDTATGDARDLAVQPGAVYTHPRFSPDGARIACARELRHGSDCFTVDLFLIDVTTGHGRVVAKNWDRAPIPETWTTGGANIVVTADDEGQVPVFRVGVSNGDVTRLTPAEQGGSHGGLRVVPGARALVGLRSRISHPPEPFRLELSAGAEPELLANLSGLSPEEGAAIARHESFTVRSDDGVAIQSHLVLPAKGKEPFPLLVWIHGGPFNQFPDGWHWRWNAMTAAAAGYAVVLPNFRGSTGFGQEFMAGAWGNTWGEAPFEDVMRVTEAVTARREIDAARVAAMGGSFGGYMANLIGGRTLRFSALVSHASLFDLSAFYGTTDHPAWFGLGFGGTPYDDPEAFDRHSPHRLVKRWKTPTLIIHGEKDYRVPIGEALSLFEALRAHEVPSELLVFPDENHWVLKPRNIRTWYRTVFDFLARQLGS